MEASNIIEYKFLGRNMRTIGIAYGIFLISWGLLISFLGSSNSLTSLIPSFIGIPIFILSILSNLFPKKEKLLMHVVVIFGLIAFLGGLDFMRGLVSETGVFSNSLAGVSKLMLLLTGAIFCYLCIQSFRFARKNKID